MDLDKRLFQLNRSGLAREYIRNMGDWYQTAADLDADMQSAEATATRLREWMISQKIIVAEPSDCVLSEGPGYVPGVNYTLAVDKPSQMLLKLQTNGVAFIAEHSVFYSVGMSDITLVCGSCGKSFKSNDPWSVAVDEWYANKGPGILRCEHCGAEVPITEWRHDPPWAFGNVGVKFWNWPALREEFLIELGKIVRHRFRLVIGKM